MPELREGRVRVEDAVVFGNAGDRALCCDLFHPPEAAGESGADRPAIVLIHGGSWSGGDRTQLRGYGIALARRGYVCMAIEYRLTGVAKWPAQLHDAKASLRYLRTHSARLGIDPTQISVSGNSAGAHLALLLAGTPDVPELEGDSGHAGAGTQCAACVAFYPPTRLYGDGHSPNAYAPGLFEPNVSEAVGRQASPIEYVHKGFPATLLIHGNRDQLVPPRASLMMYDALITAGASAELHLYEGMPHGFDASRAYFRQCVDVMQLFLDRHGCQPNQRAGQTMPAGSSVGQP
jgi:acetyl esterase/lipase